MRSRAVPRSYTEASTGPPHRCGGRTRSSPTCASTRWSFNGAAASLRRKGLGRASCESSRNTLQRGRRIAAAEGLHAGSTPAVYVCASTGPPHRCGGRWGAARPRSSRQGMLQRGRRIAAAEGSSAGAREASVTGRFNGAAASLRRKAPAPPTRTLRRMGFNGAAASLRRKDARRLRAPHQDGSASTGPPHRCGGRAHSKKLQNIEGKMLQRGRRIAAAEGLGWTNSLRSMGWASTGPPHRCGGRSGSGRSSGCTGMKLQRGRRIAAAEGGRRRLRHARLVVFASTGPPHRCGGRSQAPPPRSRRPPRFNGAAASLRRKDHNQEHLFCDLYGFNGAAASLRRKDHARSRTRSRCRSASTGPPHRCGGREGQGGPHSERHLASTGPPHRCGGR